MNYKTVTIPARDEHDGIWSRIVTLRWVCPICGGQRGEPFESVSYDGSRRLHVHSWHNPCGHVDKYSSVRQEADAMNAELPSSSLYPHRFNADVYSEGHPSDELPAYRDEAFEAEQRAMTPADYDIPAPPVSPIAVVVPDFIAAKDARIATLEARLAKIDAAFDECAKLAERELLHEEYMRLWGIRLEQLFATVVQSKPQDHAEIAARQADDNDNRSAGEGIYF